MKIVITGAMGVGKTTLSNMLSKETGIEILPEVAREMMAEGYKIDYGVTEDTEREILHRQILLEIDDDFIADRGIMDILAYSNILFKNNEELLNEIKNWLSEAEYDLIFYLPIEFPIEDDGIRSTNLEFQKQVDKEIKDILHSEIFNWKSGKPRLFTITGSKKERLKKTLEILDLNIVKST